MKMTKITIIILICSISCAGQNMDNKMKEEIKKIDSLCKAMSDEYKIEITNKIEESVLEQNKGWFPTYLSQLYDTIPNSNIYVSEKQVSEGKLLRIAEGNIRWEWAKAYFDEYLKPTEMNETEYFFLDNELVKISLFQGFPDYNAIPANYWIVMRQVDLLYQKDILVSKNAFRHVWGSVTEYDEAAAERLMKEWNVSEEMLLQKAEELLKRMINRDK